jgi:threonine/homoserine/homoserine lactone efflux protein
MLPDANSLLLFSLAALATLIFPGPAVVFVTARSLSHGPLSGWAAALGVGLGGLFHVTAAVLGLSAILLSSADAFTFLKIVGGLYLVYLGLDRLRRSGDSPGAATDGGARGLGQIIAEGVLVNATNPKTALFFLAFLPQFVDPDAPSPALQVFSLGVLFVLMGLLTDGAYASLAGAMRTFASRRPGFMRAERYVTGSTLVTVGLFAAITGRPDR